MRVGFNRAFMTQAPSKLAWNPRHHLHDFFLAIPIFPVYTEYMGSYGACRNRQATGKSARNRIVLFSYLIPSGRLDDGFDHPPSVC